MSSQHDTLNRVPAPHRLVSRRPPTASEVRGEEATTKLPRLHKLGTWISRPFDRNPNQKTGDMIRCLYVRKGGRLDKQRETAQCIAKETIDDRWIDATTDCHVTFRLDGMRFGLLALPMPSPSSIHGSTPPRHYKTFSRGGSAGEGGLPLRRTPRRKGRLLILHATASAHKVYRQTYRRMKKDALIAECEKLKLETTGTRADLIDRIWTCVSSQEESEQWTVQMLMKKKKDDLQKECVTRGLSHQGTKRQMVERLLLDQQGQKEPDLKETLEEMQHLMAHSGEIMKEMAESIVEGMGGSEDGQQPQVAEEVVAQETDDENQLRSLSPAAVRRMKKADLIGNFSRAFPDQDLKRMTRAQIMDFILEEYYGIEPSGKQKRSRQKPSKLKEKASAVEQEPESTRDQRENEEGDLARMMMLDQVKIKPGIFKGDIDTSIDNLIDEMRSLYGVHIPVQLDSPLDYMEDEDVEEKEVSQDEGAFSGLVQDEAISESGEEASADMGEGKAVDGTTQFYADLEEGTSAEEDISFDEEETGAEPVLEDEMIDLEETRLEALSKGPMGGPDMDESDIALEKATDSEEEEVADVTEDSEVIKGKRRSRNERATEAVEEEDVVEKYLSEHNVDLATPVESTEAEAPSRSVEDMAREIMEMHARDELLKMSEEKFYKLVEPLCLDVGPFREEFVDKITALAGISLGEEEDPETDLIELSLSTLDKESDEREIREQLADDAAYAPAPVIDTAPFTSETEEELSAADMEQETSSEIPLFEQSKAEEGAPTTTSANAKKEEIRSIPLVDLSDSEELQYDLNEMPTEVKEEVLEMTSPDVVDRTTAETRAEDASAVGIEPEDLVSVEEQTERVEEEMALDTSAETGEYIEEERDGLSLLEADQETDAPLTEDQESQEIEALDKTLMTPNDVPEENECIETTEEAFATDHSSTAEEVESLEPFGNGVESAVVEQDPSLQSTETNLSQLDTAPPVSDVVPSETGSDIENLNSLLEKASSVLEDDMKPPTAEASESTSDMKTSVELTPEVSVSEAAPGQLDSSTSEEMAASDAAIKNIERVLKEIRQQRIEWESSTQDIADVDVQEQLQEQEQKKETLRKDLEKVKTEFETLSQKVDENDEKIIELRKEINRPAPKRRAVLSRVIDECQLLPFDPIIGDGNGELGVFTTVYDSFPLECTSLRFSFDETTYEYSVDTAIPEQSFSPCDPSVRDQCHNNLTSASETEIFLRSASESSLASSKKAEEKNLFKKPSSIAVGLAFGVTEFCKKVFPNLFGDDPKKEDDKNRTT